MGRWMVVALAFAGTAGALETMAYRFVAEPDCVSDMRSQDAVPKMAKPPKTCFVGEGDELVDLGEWCRKRGASLEGGWAIWNQSRRMLVVRGGIVDQWMVRSFSGFGGEASQIRVSLEWFRGMDELSLPDPDSEADESLVIVSRSGQKASGEVRGRADDGEIQLKAEIEPVLCMTCEDAHIDLRLSPEWSVERDGVKDQWSVNTTVTIPVGGRVPVSGCGVVAGMRGWVLSVSGDILAIDGSSVDSLQLRETAKGPLAVSWSGSLAAVRRPVELSDVRFFRVFFVPPDFVSSLEGCANDGETNPIAPAPPPSREEPDTLSTDIRQMLCDRGVPLAVEDRGIFDACTSTLFMICRDRKNLDLIESLVFACDGKCWSVDFRNWAWLKSTQEAGDRLLAMAFIAGRNGQRADLVWWRGEDHRFGWKPEPVRGRRAETVDLGVEFDLELPKSSGGISWYRRTRMTLRLGSDREDDAGKAPDGRELRFGLRSEKIGER